MAQLALAAVALLVAGMSGFLLMSSTSTAAQPQTRYLDSDPDKPVDQALNILAFASQKGAQIVKKVLESAIANAEHNDGADIDELKVKTIYVEKGMVLKRFSARAKGRANKILKPTCHIYLSVGN